MEGILYATVAHVKLSVTESQTAIYVCFDSAISNACNSV